MFVETIESTFENSVIGNNIEPVIGNNDEPLFNLKKLKIENPLKIIIAHININVLKLWVKLMI